MTKNLMLLKIQNVMDIKGEFFQRFINILRKKISEGAVKMTVCQTIN